MIRNVSREKCLKCKLECKLEMQIRINTDIDKNEALICAFL